MIQYVCRGLFSAMYVCTVVGHGGFHLPAICARAEPRGRPIKSRGGPRPGPQPADTLLHRYADLT